MSKFKPMLAETLPAAKMDTCPLPMIAMPKLDGLRCLVMDGLKSRTLKTIPNLHTRSLFERPELEGMDGELIVGLPTAQTVFQDSQSGVMSINGQPDVRFYVFDLWDCPHLPYSERLRLLTERVTALSDPRVVLVGSRVINTHAELEDYENYLLDFGYEGVILRHPEGEYKYGRSTLSQAWMLKLKRFEDSEAEIVGFVEGMTNGNLATVDARGLTTRSSHKDNMIPSGTLGALKVRDIHTGWAFEIGTGFTQAQASEIWENRSQYVGKLVKYQFFRPGMKDLPRFPSYKGLRHRDDVGDPVQSIA